MIYKTAYDTTLGQAFHMAPIEQELKKAISQNGPTYFSFKEYDVISSVNFLQLQITNSNARYSEIAHFNHPIAIEHFKDQNFLILDSRLFLKEDLHSNSVLITNKSEYDFSLKRYFINSAWLNLGPGQIKSSLHFGASVYSYWLSEIISRRFVLDPLDQLKLSIVTNYFYQQLFSNLEELSEDTKQAMVSFAVKTIKIPAKLGLEIVDQITLMPSVKEYCENVSRILDNIRLKEFNTGLLYTIVGMNWYGLNAKETIAIAIEHVPTWLAILYTAITNKTYKSSTISNVALKYSKGGLGEEFTKNFILLIESLAVPVGRQINQRNQFLSAEQLLDQINKLEKVQF
jgi:hypothetical protein